MATPSESPAVVFGPFEVNPGTGELRKSGTRIRLSGQPLRILVVLLEHSGELVTREQLREQLWAGGTFVDFEGGLNAAINKLRRTLSDSAESPRYIETVPAQGYRFIGNVQRPVSRPVPADMGPILYPSAPQKRDIRRWLWPVTIPVCAAVSIALGWRLHELPEAAPAAWRFSQLTTDTGLSMSPALSPDGKLVAYSSDRGEEGYRDLYVKQVAGGQPIRLTTDGLGNVAPSFSPDGSRIAFRSNRNGGGIYVIPALGGEPRLLARDGWNPQFSPDGSQVVFWVGGINVATAVPGSGAVWVVPATGGQPRRVGQHFTNARYPVWSPDGKRLLLTGYLSTIPYRFDAVDWWIVPVNGGEPVRTGARDALVRAGLEASDLDKNPAATFPNPNVPRPGCWLAAGSRVIFSTVSGDARSLWETTISPSGRVSGGFRRLTAGAGNEVEPSCSAGGVLAFTSMESRRDVWAMPFDLNGGKPKAAMQRVTQDRGRRDYPSLSADGRYVAFASDQSGRMNIWLRELQSGKDTHVAGSSFVQRFPLVSASGARIAFSSYENGKRLLYVSSPGGVPEQLCEGCLRATDWSRGEKSLLVFGGSPYQVNILDIASRRQTPLLKHPTYQLLYGRFSSDNRWVSFLARTGPSRARILIAPVDGPAAVPESSWIPISEEGAEDWANWSPDGRTLYFTSERDGHACLWGQRLDQVSHRPLGDAFAVQHLHGRLSYQQGGWSAGGGRIALVLTEGSGNIWMMSGSGAH